MKSTVFFSIIVLIIQAVLAFFIEEKISGDPYFKLILCTIAYYSLFLIIGMRILLKSIKGRPQAFVYTFMGYSGLKLFSSAMLIVGLGLGFREILIELALSILLQYFIYTAFEIIHLRKALLKVERK